MPRRLRISPSGPPAEGINVSALQLFNNTIVPPGSDTLSVDDPIHTAAETTGDAVFQDGTLLDLEWLTQVSGTGAGDVFATLSLDYSIDGQVTWIPITEQAISWFTAAALNNPVTTAVMRAQVDISGAPSFSIRAHRINDVTATQSASFSAPRVEWSLFTAL